MKHQPWQTAILALSLILSMAGCGKEQKSVRSEEGRVGEEGRSRGAPDHLKKKKAEAPEWPSCILLSRRPISTVSLTRKTTLWTARSNVCPLQTENTRIAPRLSSHTLGYLLA